MINEGSFPDKRIEDDFFRLYSIREQKAVFATLKLMQYFNMLTNVFNKKGSRLLRKSKSRNTAKL